MSRRTKRRKRLLREQSEEFLKRTGMTPNEFLKRWRANELDDNLANNLDSHEAICLEDPPVEQRHRW